MPRPAAHDPGRGRPMTWRTLLAAPLIAAIWVAVRAVGILDDLHLALADDPWED